MNSPNFEQRGKRVVLVVSAFPKLSESFIVHKFLGLAARDWDAHVVCQDSGPAEWQKFPDLFPRLDLRHRVHASWPHRPKAWALALCPLAVLICLVRNPVGTWRYLRGGWRRWGLGVLRRLYLDADIVALAPDLVHFEFGSLAVGRLHLRSLLGCRVVVSFRGYDLNCSGLDDPDYLREVWDQADALHLLSENLWQRARQRGCPDGKPHVLIPPAVDPEFFHPAAPRGEPAPEAGARPLRILSVGRFTWEKGYEYAIQAVRLLRDHGVACTYRMVGDGRFFEPLMFARYQFDLGQEVEVLGALSGQEVRQEMEQADVFLHAAVSEGFCNAVMEAQAMGLPVVCTDAGGLPENVANGETGFVVPRRDACALADKLAVLARDPALRRQMGAAGQQRVRRQFPLEAQITAFEQLYVSVLQGGLVPLTAPEEQQPAARARRASS